MKKLIAGLFAAILTTAGLVAVTSSVPAAADCRSGYACQPTTATKPKPQTIKAGKKPKPVKVDIKTRGNVKAKGTVVVTVKGPGGFSKKFSVKYNGKPVNVKLPALKKPGKYKVSIVYNSADGFRDSKTSSTITVKKK